MKQQMTAAQLAELDAALKRRNPDLSAITYEYEMLKVCLGVEGAPAHFIMYALGRVTGEGLFDIGLILDHEYRVEGELVYFPDIAVYGVLDEG